MGGLVARVEIGQILFSVRSKDGNEAHVIEAMRRAKYKFPGRQSIVVSRCHGFTGLDRKLYKKFKEQGRLTDMGVHVRVNNGKGPLDEKSILIDGDRDYKHQNHVNHI